MFCLVLLVSLLERHPRLHDPLCHVVLRWNYCWNPLFCPLLSLWEVQSVLCCWHHVLCFKWVEANISKAHLVMFESILTLCILIIDLDWILKHASLYLSQSSLCSARNGHLHGGDSELSGQALWWLAFLLVIHTRLGGTADDLLCRFVLG